MRKMTTVFLGRPNRQHLVSLTRDEALAVAYALDTLEGSGVQPVVPDLAVYARARKKLYAFVGLAP